VGRAKARTHATSPARPTHRSLVTGACYARQPVPVRIRAVGGRGATSRIEGITGIETVIPSSS
jgi:hypothetical protein